MSDVNLKYKPLVEAFVEIRWKLRQDKAGRHVDPHYKFLLGRLFDEIKEEYPQHEPLPASNIPDEMTGHIVQHRFRASENGWPLIQVGPGILTVNETENYLWSSFKQRAVHVIGKLFKAYPKYDDLNIQNIFLKYIDVIDFDYGSENLFRFLMDKLKINVILPDILFDETGVESYPQTLNWETSFKCKKPKGQMTILFATGYHKREKENVPALVWNTTVHSQSEDIPAMPDGFENWLEEAHTITHDWFFKLIEGDLERRFKGE